MMVAVDLCLTFARTKAYVCRGLTVVTEFSPGADVSTFGPSLAVKCASVE